MAAGRSLALMSRFRSSPGIDIETGGLRTGTTLGINNTSVLRFRNSPGALYRDGANFGIGTLECAAAAAVRTVHFGEMRNGSQTVFWPVRRRRRPACRAAV